jgi:hypothetical protein
MTMRTVISAALVWLMLGIGAQAQETEIRDTISAQFDAFRADDFARAFEFASPQLQLMFRTPENFRTMVTRGYPMVWHPSRVQFLELREEGGDRWQRVMVTDAGGTAHLLDYRMIETADGWRISAVQILDSTGIGA